MGFGDRFRKVMGIPVNPDPVALRRSAFNAALEAGDEIASLENALAFSQAQMFEDALGAFRRMEERFAERGPLVVKSGIVAGMGESDEEILETMADLRAHGVDVVTIGQYLQPTRKHHPVIRFVTPDEFKSFETVGRSKGFLLVSSSPLTRSSHHAGEDFAKLKAARLALHAA